jgi:hypothetical protein
MPVVALALGRGAWIHPQVCLTPRQTRAVASPEVCADRDLSLNHLALIPRCLCSPEHEAAPPVLESGHGGAFRKGHQRTISFNVTSFPNAYVIRGCVFVWY